MSSNITGITEIECFATETEFGPRIMESLAESGAHFIAQSEEKLASEGCPHVLAISIDDKMVVNVHYRDGAVVEQEVEFMTVLMIVPRHKIRNHMHLITESTEPDS